MLLKSELWTLNIEQRSLFQIAQWDLALERDAETEADDPAMKDLPPQLLFIHQGLKDVKEIHWHRKVSGLMMATSHTGLDVFRTISVWSISAEIYTETWTIFFLLFQIQTGL